MSFSRILISLAILLGLALAASPAWATLTCPQAYKVSNQGGQWAGPDGWSQREGLDPSGSEKIENFVGAQYQEGFMICLYNVSGHYGSGQFAKLAKPAPGAPLPVSGTWECESWYRTNCACYLPNTQACAFPASMEGGTLIGR